MNEPGLSELRKEVAEATAKVIELVAERNGLAERIGELKSKDAVPMEDERVEDSLVAEVLELCRRRGVDERAGLKILSTLISESKRVQGVRGKKEAITPMMIASKAMQIQRSGRKLLRLDVGEPDFHPPRKVLEATSEALFAFKTHYVQTRGIPDLISALQGYLKRKHSYTAKEGELMVTPGGRFAIYAALSATVGEGESVVMIDPNWPAYKEGLRHIGARAMTVSSRLEESWEPSLEEVKEAIRPNTRAILLSYPGNPTGKIVKPSVFKELLGIANDRKLTVISDEIYTDYAYSPCPSILQGGAERFILTSSFSKTWAMTGFRVGYAVSSEEVIGKMAKLGALMVTSVPEFIQYGAIKALDCDAEVAENARAMRERIDAASAELDAIEGIEYCRPDGAMYVFPRVRRPGFDSSSFALKLLEEKGVSVSPGGGFGDYPACFRISLGQSKQTVVEGIRKIGELLG